MSHRDQINARKKRRRETDPAFLIIERLRCRLNQYVKIHALKKLAHTDELIDMAPSALAKYLKAQIPRGCKLNDYHIDHIFPMTSYNLVDIDEQKRCMHWSNLQMLSCTDNISKSNRLPTRTEAARVHRCRWPRAISESDLS